MNNNKQAKIHSVDLDKVLVDKGFQDLKGFTINSGKEDNRREHHSVIYLKNSKNSLE